MNEEYQEDSSQQSEYNENVPEPDSDRSQKPPESGTDKKK